MSLFDDYNRFFSGGLLGGIGRPQPISAAGRMLQRLDSADSQAKSCPVTDELLCALRRADILSRRDPA